MHARRLGKRLARARYRTGLSCIPVATALGLPPRLIHAWEAADGPFALALLQQLASLYGLTVTALISGVSAHRRPFHSR